MRPRLCVLVVGFGAYTHARRFILADTDRLHRKIAEMSDRIRQLEDGLAILQSSVTREPYPLLAGDFLKIKSGLELHSASELAASERLRDPSSAGAGFGAGVGVGGAGAGLGLGKDEDEELGLSCR